MPEPHSAEEFHRLLDRAAQGEEAALEQLAQTYAGVLRRAARGLLGPALRPMLDSLDLVQSVHRTLLIGLRKQQFDVSTPDQLVALALVLLRRKIARHWRRLKRQPDAIAPQPLGSDSKPLPAATPARNDPAEAALWGDEVNHVLNQLEGLDRQLVELRLQGYTTAEAARQLGLEPPILRVRLARLRKRLQERGLLREWL